LGLAHRYDSGRALKLQRVRECVRVGECAPGLAHEDVPILRVELTETKRCPLIVAEKVKFKIPLDVAISGMRRLPELGVETRWPRGDGGVYGMRLRARRKAGRHIRPVV